MHTCKTAIIVACSIFWVTTASAAGAGGYIGGAFGGTVFEDDGRYSDYAPGLELDDESSGAMVFGGFNFNHFIGIEGTIANLGEFESTDGTLIDTFGVVAVTAIFRIPAGRGPVSFFGKAGLGVVTWEEEDLLDPWRNDEDSGGALALGFGVTFTPRTESYLSFRIAFDLYSFVFDDLFLGQEYDQAIGMSSVGMQFNF